MAKTLTPNYSLGKWDDGDNPGASQLNANWTGIDTAMRGIDLLQQTYEAEEQMDINNVAASDLLLKTFFRNNGWLPSTTKTESLYAMPAFDFNLGISTTTRNGSFAKIVGAANPQVVGWDLGASYSKVLFIVGGCHIAANSLGLAVIDSVPVNVSLTGSKSVYHELVAFATNGTRLQSYSGGGGYATLASSAELLSQAAGPYAWNSAGAAAIYYDCAAHIAKGFVRVGSECWWEDLSVTDSSLASIRAVSFFQFNGSQHVVSPIGIYVQ